MHVCNRYPKQLSKTELLAWHGREKKTTSDKLWKLKWFSVISSVPRWHSSLCWTAALTVTTYNLLWCLRFELFEVTMKVQLWSSGLEMASRWWNKDTFEPLKHHDAGSWPCRGEPWTGSTTSNLCPNIHESSSLSFVIHEWKTCLIGSKVRRQSQKIWWSYGDLRSFGPLYLCLVKQHLTSVIIWLSYFYQEPHHQQTPVTKF